MNGKYVGYVDGQDPLHGFLSMIIRDRMDVRESRPAFRAFQLSGSKARGAGEEAAAGRLSARGSRVRVNSSGNRA
jgi:hypothetical protein